MRKKKKRRYNYRRSTLRPRSGRYRYNTPINFKLAQIIILIIIILMVFIMVKNKKSKATHHPAQEKIATFEVAPEVSTQIFQEAKNNKKDVATLFASHVLGIEKKILLSRKNKTIFREAVACYKQFILDIEGFPIPMDYEYSYEDSWLSERTYGGTRRHYGTDIMDPQNERGVIPIVSMSKGIVENIGWNDQGGYRVGVRTPSGAYVYYAHLDQYASDLNKGTKVEVGDPIGYMGDSGYGEEGTVGQFPVHLHIGIATKSFGDNENWINPYYLLRYLEDKDMQILKSRGIF